VPRPLHQLDCFGRCHQNLLLCEQVYQNLRQTLYTHTHILQNLAHLCQPNQPIIVMTCAICGPQTLYRSQSSAGGSGSYPVSPGGRESRLGDSPPTPLSALGCSGDVKAAVRQPSLTPGMVRPGVSPHEAVYRLVSVVTQFKIQRFGGMASKWVVRKCVRRPASECQLAR
jgi:hypothetical protein